MPEAATPRFALPLLAAGQAQKEMYHNEALTRLDLVTNGAVQAAGAVIPPDAPEIGACWLLGTVPSGDWAGHGGEVAGWTAGGWRFLMPCEGMRLWVAEQQCFAMFSEGYWVIGRAHGRLFVDGVQVVGAQGAAIAEPSGGSVVDAEARAAILLVLEGLREHGLIQES